MEKIKKLPNIFAVVLLFLGASMACKLITPSGGGTEALGDCYQVSFLGYSQSTDLISTWRYTVSELPCAQDLSNWALELPVCATVVDASPSPWEVVQPDPNFGFDGIKWQTGAGFQSGEFVIVLSGGLVQGTVQTGVKGSDVAVGTIAGPVCKKATNTPETVTATIAPTGESTPVPSLQPPASSGPIIITENGQALTFTCNGNAVEVRGNANVITLLGSCHSITVKGNGNRVYWQSGAPVITNTGNENIISQR
jgi:hypothetical protein